MGEDKSRQNNKPKKQPSHPLGIEPETVSVTKSADKSKIETKRLIINKRFLSLIIFLFE